MDVIHKEVYKGYTIKIHTDEDAMNPREDCDELGTMVAFHKRYTLGDKHDLKADDYAGWDEMEEHIRKNLGAIIVLPLGLYDHSGITMYVGSGPGVGDSAGWDSGQVGFYYLTKAKFTKEYGKVTKRNLATAERVMRSEIETYDHYLRGDVYGYTITDPNGEDGDSCWGFIGYYDDKDYGALKEAKSAVDYELKNNKEYVVVVESSIALTVRAKDEAAANDIATGIVKGRLDSDSAIIRSVESKGVHCDWKPKAKEK